MKALDSRVENLLCEIFYAGSYYDGLKISRPDEYDIDLVFGTKKIKKRLLNITSGEIPGYVKVELTNRSGYEMLCINGTSYLDAAKVMQWIQSLIQKVFNSLDHDHRRYDLRPICKRNIYATITRKGPALTLTIRGQIDHKICVDLVPCFYCFPDQWPKSFQPNPYPEMGFRAIPKSPKVHGNRSGLYWRLSCQEQEMELLKRQQSVKPALRILKKLRDTQNHPMPSYFLKTIILHEIQRYGTNFWRNKTLSDTFLYFLKVYLQKLKDGCITYYWDHRHNLLDISRSTSNNLGNQIERMIKDIERNLESPGVAAKYLLSSSEYKKIFEYGNVPERAIRKARMKAEKALWTRR